MKVAAIIPTRGSSRKVFTHYQVERAKQMGYDKVYLIDYMPGSAAFDLMDRIKVGVNLARLAGIEYVSIIEDDDHYDLNYLDVIKKELESAEVVGINRTTYYHLFNTGHKLMNHPGRSSMFCTSFHVNAFESFSTHGSPFHDIQIWKYVTGPNSILSYKLIDADIAIGIKHGKVFGAVGGNGHFMSYSYTDPNLSWLKKRIDAEAFTFYRELKTTFQNTWAHGSKS